MTTSMHADEVAVDERLVCRLLREQYPDWANLSIKRVSSASTDHALFRIGSALVARLPRRPSASVQVGKEQRWLPALAPHLPVAIPHPVGLGQPGSCYPWHWSIYEWIDGETATSDQNFKSEEFAVRVASFINALRGIDVADGPIPGQHNAWRGQPLAERDRVTRDAIRAVSDIFDAALLNAAWSRALEAPIWTAPPSWIHGDLLPSNLLVRDGQLAAVIDFGLLGVGDPAVDLMIAWVYLRGAARAVFRHAVDLDAATWERGRGWTLSWGVVALAYYRDVDPTFAELSRLAVEQTLRDGSVCD